MPHTEVLQVITDTDRRGAQVFADDLGAALTARGRSVRTVALAPGANEERLAVPVLGPSRRSLSTLRALRREISGAAVTIAHGSSTLPTCALASVGLRRRTVYRQISDSLFWASTPGRRARVRLSMRQYDRIVALFPGAADTLVQSFGVARDAIRVVPNGTPVERFPLAAPDDRRTARIELGVESAGSVVAYVGALVPEKGVDLAVRATGLLPEVTLLVVGDGPERNTLEALARECAPGRVRFTGSIKQPADAYAAADVLVLASRGGDSMPAVLIEAAFVGRPAVATPIQGIPEIVIDRRTGRLVEPEDPEALADGLQDALLHGVEYAKAAREWCLERFAITAVGQQWDAVLAELVTA